VQRAHTLKAGGWTVESVEAQQRLSFESLYDFLEAQHSRRERHDLRDAVTNKLVHRYVLPFKQMKVPPAADNLFKYRKGAKRLSEWITQEGTAVGLAEGIIAMRPPEIVAAPPGAARREAKATVAWKRANAAQRRRSRLRSVQGDSTDAEETRQLVEAVMESSDALPFEDDEFAAALERELEQADSDGEGDDNGASNQQSLEEIERMLMADSDHEVEDDGAFSS